MRVIIAIIVFILPFVAASQSPVINLNTGWLFQEVGTDKWYTAQVPGTVHSDLLSHNIIPDPFYRDNETKVQWVETKTWEYKKPLTIPIELLKKNRVQLRFDGLDTYADVYLNGHQILQADNMFRQWTVDVKSWLKQTTNELRIVFKPSAEIAKQLKSSSSISYPDNERVFVRKAQYQFGWDWGPRLVTCGIWKDVRIVTSNKTLEPERKDRNSWNIKLVTSKDTIGEAFYFTVNGKRTFIKGANWIPSDNFLPRAKKLKRYEQLIKAAKEAHVNMFRVWGGGVYEDDEFYDLCDKYGIMVWQDFMFAGAMYPGDSSFYKNVKEEVRYQVKRLRHHPCIALWCGNNEIEEAWNNWHWQQQYNYSVEDSSKLWNDYKTIFHSLIPSIVKELDPERRYWPSSPSLGWGRDSAYKKGDVHYWGVWWGKEPVEKYNEKIGRFNSEYGMQSFPDMQTIRLFTEAQDRDTASSVMRTHEKHATGYENLKFYIEQKFRTPKTFDDLVYVSQLMQADAMQTAIEAHRRNEPVTMGTMFWQWNDCWPVVSWSAIDYYGHKKALYYQVKRSFQNSTVLPCRDSSGEVVLFARNATNSKVSLCTRYLDFKKGIDSLKDWPAEIEPGQQVKLRFDDMSNKNLSNGVYHFSLSNGHKVVAENFLFAVPPKELSLPIPVVKATIKKQSIEVVSDQFAYGVHLIVPDGVQLEDNYFHLMPNQKKIVKFTSQLKVEEIRKQLKIKSLVDTY